MTVSPGRPRGRRPGKVDTRGAILAAALELFSRDGYDKVSLRAVARQAGVDPALVHHYFESKADLFSRAVIDQAFDPTELLDQVLAAPPEEVGRITVTGLLRALDPVDARTRAVAMLREAVNVSPGTRPLAEFLASELLVRVAEHFGHRDARYRAAIAASTFAGLLLARDILAIPQLTKVKRSTLVTSFAPVLQRYLVDQW